MVYSPNSPTRDVFNEAPEGKHRLSDCSQISASQQTLRKDAFSTFIVIQIIPGGKEDQGTSHISKSEFIGFYKYKCNRHNIEQNLK